MVWKVDRTSVALATYGLNPVWPLQEGSSSALALKNRDTREQTSLWPTPIVKSLRQAETIFHPAKNRYDMVDKFVENDPELAAGIDIKSSMVRKSYRGMYLKVGRAMTPEEDVLNEYLKTFEGWLNFKRLFKVISEKMLTYGDWPMIKEMKGGLPSLRNMPIKYMSSVDNIRQLENVDAQIFNGNWYVLNEWREARRRIWHRSKVLHFSIAPEGAEVYDQYGRYVFGVWSKSPLRPLFQYILWKHNIIITDIMLRHKMLPREVHKVNTLGINPSTVGDPGDAIDIRIQKANAEIRRVLEEYERNTAYIGPDRGYIIQREGVEIEVLEPKSLNYHKPNEIISQINAAYAKRLGIPISELTVMKTSSYAESVIKTSFSTIRTIDIAQVIADKLLEYVREHIIKTYPAFANLVDNIVIDIDIVMDQEEERRFRIAALMREIGEFTSEEIRLVCGYEKLTDEQQKEIDEMLKRSAEAEARAMVGRTPGAVSTQETQRRGATVRRGERTPSQRERDQVGLEVFAHV